MYFSILLSVAKVATVLVGCAFFSIDLEKLFSPTLVSLIRYGLWFSSMFFISLRYRRALAVMAHNPLVLIVAGMGIASFLWSEYPQESINRARDLTYTTTFGIFLATCFDIRQQVWVLTGGFGMVALCNLYGGIAMPNVAIHRGDVFDGAWRGLTPHKNEFGALATLSTVFSFISVRRLNAYSGTFIKGAILALFALSIAFVFLTTSMSSLVIAFAVLGVVFSYDIFHWKGESTIVIASLGVLVAGYAAIIIFGNWTEILTAMDRDPTLTGRTLIWSSAFDQLPESSFLGFGRNAFWTKGSARALDAGLRVSPNGGYIPPHSHNGFIDLMLDVGVLGLTFFIASYLLTLFRAARQAYCSRTVEDLWPLAMSILVISNNMTESLLMRGAMIYWALYVAAALTAGRPARPLPGAATEALGTGPDDRSATGSPPIASGLPRLARIARDRPAPAPRSQRDRSRPIAPPALARPSPQRRRRAGRDNHGGGRSSLPPQHDSS